MKISAVHTQIITVNQFQDLYKSKQKKRKRVIYLHCLLRQKNDFMKTKKGSNHNQQNMTVYIIYQS